MGSGQFKGLVASNGAPCISCPANSWSPEASDGASHCECEPGFSGTITGTGTASGGCSVCPTNTYKASRSTAACDACPDNAQSVSNSKALSDCKCRAGYTGTDGGTCTSCDVGKYKDTVGSAQCAFCEAGKYNGDSASTSENACT